MSDTSLIFNLIGKDNISSVLGGAGGSFDKFGLAVVGGGVAAAAGLAKLGSDFDNAYDKIQQGTGATGATFEGLKNDMKKVLSEVPAGMDVVSDAVTTLHQRTGATGPTLQKLSEQFVRLADMSGTDVKVAIESASGAFNKWGVATGDQSKQLDFLFTVAQKTGVPLDRITEIMAGSGTTLQQFGMGFEDSAQSIGSMQKAGINVESAMAGMKTGLANLSAAGKDPVAAFKELSAKIKGAGTDAEANAIAIGVFGKKGGPELAAAMRSGAFGAAELKGAMGDTTGAIVKTAKGTDDFKEKLEILKNKGMVALEPLAMKVFDSLTHLADGLKTATEWAGKHKDIMVPLGIALGVIATAFVAIKIGMAAYHGVMTVAHGVTAAYTAVQWALNLAMSANPIGLIIIAIVALVAAFVILWNKSEGFRDFWIGAWNAIKGGVEAAIGWITGVAWPAIVGFFSGIADKANEAKQWVIDRFSDWVNFVLSIPGRIAAGLQGMWQFFMDAVAAAKQWAIDRFGELLGWVSGLPGAVWDRVQSMWNVISDKAGEIKQWAIDRFGELLGWVSGLPGAVWDRVQSMWNVISDKAGEIKQWAIDRLGELLGWVSGLPGAIWDRVSGMWNVITDKLGEAKQWAIDRLSELVSWVQGMPGSIGDGLRNMWNGLKDGFKEAINFVIRGWNNLELEMPGINVFGKEVGGFTLRTPNIPELAAGGSVTGAGMALIGERGPELLHLPQGATVEPLPQPRLAASGTQKIEITNVLEFRGGNSEFRTMLQNLVRRYGAGDVQAAFGNP